MPINFDGVIVSLLTPMNEDYCVDFFGLKNLCARLLNKGVENFLILGDYSEQNFLDYSFQKKIIVSASRELKNKGNLVVGCFSDSSEEIIEKVKFAEKYCEYCLVNIPFNALTNEVEFIDFFDNLFTRTKSKIILYNNPSSFKRNIPINGLNRIVGWERLIGIFDNSKNKAYFRALCDYHQLLKIFQCFEPNVIESQNYTCAGNVSGLANVFPELFLSIKKDFEKNGYNSMLRQEIFLIRLFEKIPTEKEIQIYKKMLSVEGVVQEYFNNNLTSLSEKEFNIIQEMLKKNLA
ncbi:MAG: dihydrodipicolinate synthase family protein [Candidatus ainarchaeum sp.]|nr:dihydrodipicolinate synthase family protein [Candidatus ainarchaeum sp.]